MMAGQKVRRVTATERPSGAVRQGIQDIDTGIVYTFLSAEDAADAVVLVNDGTLPINRLVPMFQQADYAIEEVD